MIRSAVIAKNFHPNEVVAGIKADEVNLELKQRGVDVVTIDLEEVRKEGQPQNTRSWKTTFIRNPDLRHELTNIVIARHPDSRVFEFHDSDITVLEKNQQFFSYDVRNPILEPDIDHDAIEIPAVYTQQENDAFIPPKWEMNNRSLIGHLTTQSDLAKSEAAGLVGKACIAKIADLIEQRLQQL